MVHPLHATSCDDYDLEAFEECYSEVIHMGMDDIRSECSVTRRQSNVNIVITILATNDAERQAILDALNNENLVDLINTQLTADGDDGSNHLGSAESPSVVSTGNLTQHHFYPV